MRHICVDPIRADLEIVKSAWENVAKGHKEKKDWQYAESLAAIRIVERTLKYELTYEQAVLDLGDSIRKSIAAGGVAVTDEVVVKVAQFADDVEAAKEPQSPRMAYLAIARYLRAAEESFTSIEEQTSAWSAVLPDEIVKRLKKETDLIRGEKKTSDYVRGKDCQRSIGGAISVAKAAADDVTGCIHYEDAKHNYKQLRMALQEIRAIYCRILCLTRHTGILVQGLVRDNVRIAFLEVARYLELAFRTFEEIRQQEPNCIGELKAAVAGLSTHAGHLNREIARWTKIQMSQINIAWQSEVASLNVYIQQATTQVGLLQGTSTVTNLKTVGQLVTLSNQMDDLLRSIYCRFERHHDFRIEVCDGLWGGLIELRCATACFYREEREAKPTVEKQLHKLFEALDFLKGLAGAPAAGPPLAPDVAPASATAYLPAPVTVSVAPTAISPQLPDYWITAQTLVAGLKSIAPNRLKEDIADQWIAHAQSQVTLLTTPAGANLPPGVLFNQTAQAWSLLYAKLSAVIAIEKGSGTSMEGAKLDAFTVSLDALNQQMLASFGQTSAPSISTVATGGAQS